MTKKVILIEEKDILENKIRLLENILCIRIHRYGILLD